jgi:hypothetical protein
VSPELWDVPLFEDIPKPYRRPAKAKKAESWRLYSSRRRLTCDLCILDAHAGTVFVPMAHTHHVYTTAERVWNLCVTHGAQVKTGERKLPR